MNEDRRFTVEVDGHLDGAARLTDAALPGISKLHFADDEAAPPVGEFRVHLGVAEPVHAAPEVS